MKNKFCSILLVFAASIFLSCQSKSIQKNSIAVFVPGIIDDSPIYKKMVNGVKEAVTEYNEGRENSEAVKPFIFEAGTDQAQWQNQLTSLVVENKYDVIISSNPSMPDLAVPLTKKFPSQKFIFLDATCSGNANIETSCYKQDEEAYITGFIAGLMTKSNKIGLISAQDYPVMNNIIFPQYERGAKAANASVFVDYRIVGNWWDAKKGAELADSMYLSGIDVILPICGGASQGVIASAKEHNFYLCWFDSNTYSVAPGLVISCAASLQEKLSKEKTLEYLQGKTKWGTASELGMKEGYIKLLDDDPLYIQTVPENIRVQVKNEIAKILEK